MTIKIYMENVNSKIEGVPLLLAKKISKLLTFTVSGFGGSSATCLYDLSNHITHTGLIPRVIKFLHESKIKFEVIDKRVKPKQNANFKLMEGFTMRDYQESIVNRSSSREIIQAATGAGKTFIMYCLAVKFNVKPLVVIAPKVSLAEQIKDEFEKFSGQKIGIIGGGYYDIQDITVCTPMSAPRELLESANMIMFDECHCIPSHSVFNTAAMAKNAYYRIGVSATPWRDGGDDLMIEAALSIRKPHLSLNASTLIEKEKLTPCSIVFVPYKKEFKWPGNYNDLYNQAIVNNEERNSIISTLAYKMLQKKRTTLILIKNIKHGDMLVENLRKKCDISCKVVKVNNQEVVVHSIDFLSGRDSKERRKAVLNSVKEGFTKILIGSTIADEGLDLSILDCLILAGGGKSSTRAFQRIGRVLRLHPKKDNAIVFDILDETKTFKRHALTRKALYQTEPMWNIQTLQTK